MKGTTRTPTTRAQHVYYTKPPANTADGSSDHEMTVGSLSNDECDDGVDDGSENVVKNEFASFQTLSRLLVDPLYLSNVADFS